jgi:hypothetical protein
MTPPGPESGPKLWDCAWLLEAGLFEEEEYDVAGMA